MASSIDTVSDSSMVSDDAFPKQDMNSMEVQTRQILDSERNKIWQQLLDIKDEAVHWDEFFDLPEQINIRRDCQSFVDRLGNGEEERVSVVCDVESVITRHCKATGQPYAGPSWLDIQAPLIALGFSRTQIFHCFQSILSLYIPNPQTKNFYHLFRLLILYHEPELCSFLDSKKITVEQFSETWFKSIFASQCDLKVIQTIWDIYFQNKNPFLIFFLALVIMVNSKESLLQMKDEPKEDILRHIKSAPCALGPMDVEDFCLLAQYYCQRTPQDFLKKNKELIFNEDQKQDPILFQALCLPVAVDELIQENQESQIHFFVVDCRPAEHYNSGHLPTAYHLDATLMLQEPAQFSTAVQALWSAQKQAHAARSAAWGEHICFMGSGNDDEDQYMNMAVAHFLQRGQQYLSVAYGGFPALHSLGHTLLSDHSPHTCSLCGDTQLEEKSLFERFASVMKAVSSEMKDYINNVPAERHVSMHDRLGKRYRETVFSIDDEIEETMEDEEEVCIKTWIKKEGVLASFKCEEIRENKSTAPGLLILTRTHLYLLRENPHKKGFAHIVSRHSLLNLVKITSKKRFPHFITFKYGENDDGQCQITAIQRLIIEKASDATQAIRDHILDLMGGDN